MVGLLGTSTTGGVADDAVTVCNVRFATVLAGRWLALAWDVFEDFRTVKRSPHLFHPLPTQFPVPPSRTDAILEAGRG
jgi:hypothetical protein